MPYEENKKPTAIDLFCGAGGLSSGLQKAGFHILGAVDAWEPAVRSYGENFAHPVLLKDVAALSASDLQAAFSIGPRLVDLLAGGPPCQGFSVQRIGEDIDDRNDLIFEFARLTETLRPRMFLMENVPGLLGKRGRHLALRFASRLGQSGYSIRTALINAADYGVPQIRKRVFFCGWLHSEVAPFYFPEPVHSPDTYMTAWQAIGDLPSPPNNNTPLPGDALHRRMHLSKLNQERLRLIPPGKGFESLPVEMRVDCHKEGAEKIGHRYVYGRLAPDLPAGTITARFDSFTRGKFAHPYEDRNITLREGARLQTFDDTHVFVGTQEEIAALIGNAIPPRLAAAIGCAIRNHLVCPPSEECRTIVRTHPHALDPQLELFSVHSDH